MKSVRCLAYCRNEDPSFRGTEEYFTMERKKKSPLTMPSGGKIDEHTQAVEEEGCHGNISHSR